MKLSALSLALCLALAPVALAHDANFINDAATEISTRLKALETADTLQQQRDAAQDTRDNATSSQLLRIEADIVKLLAGPVPVPPPVPVPVPDPAPIVQKPLVTMCAVGCDVTTLADGVAMTTPGGTLTVEPGVYAQCVQITKPMNLIGKVVDGKRAHLQGVACNGKAALNIGTLALPDVKIQGFEISGITVPDRNGACIRIPAIATSITVRDVICRDSQNGILGSANKQLLIENSHFENNGKDARAHGLYINGGENLIIRDTNVIVARTGHLVKTGAKSTLIENSTIAMLGGAGGTQIDAYAGGALTVRGSVLQQAKGQENHDMIRHGTETGRLVAGAPYPVLIENSTLLFDDAVRCCRWIASSSTMVNPSFNVRNNVIVGDPKGGSTVPVLQDNTSYADRAAAGYPAYDGTLASLTK